MKRLKKPNILRIPQLKPPSGEQADKCSRAYGDHKTYCLTVIRLGDFPTVIRIDRKVQLKVIRNQVQSDA